MTAYSYTCISPTLQYLIAHSYTLGAHCMRPHLMTMFLYLYCSENLPTNRPPLNLNL
jgi:hypothetical protein